LCISVIVIFTCHQPSWLRPTSARRLLVLRHGPSDRLQGIAIVAGYEPPVQRSANGRRDPRFDFCAHARTCAARLLNSRAHTAHTQPSALVGPVSTALGSSHGCNPSTACPSDRYTPHPCVFAAHHMLHARPPDASGCAFASDTYYSLELRSSPSV
jgi:hypothetical protein